MHKTKQIIQAIQESKNDKVLDVLYKSLLPSIIRFIKSKGGNKVQAEDCFQDGVVSLINKVKRNEFNEESEIDNYVFTVAKNRWYNMATRVKSREAELGNYDDKVSDGLEYLYSEEKNKVIDKLFTMLGERCKELLSLYIFENKKMAEIKEILGLNSEEVVKSTKYRCKKKMKDLLQKYPEYKTIIRS